MYCSVEKHELVIISKNVPVPEQESGIPVPHHICVNREGLPEGGDPPGFIETEDYVELDGARSLLPCLRRRSRCRLSVQA